MFCDRTELTLFWAGTVPETVPVRSLDFYKLSFLHCLSYVFCLFVSSFYMQRVKLNLRSQDPSVETKTKNRFNKDLCQHFFTEKIINIWNSLDKQTVMASSLNNFKWNLDRLRRSGQVGLVDDLV